MSLSKALTLNIIVTGLALMIVHQQVEITKAGYRIKQQKGSIKQALDQNQALLYNISTLESPRHIQDALLNLGIDGFCFPAKETVILTKASTRQTGPEAAKGKGALSKIFAFLSISSEAQAKTISK